MSDSLPCHTQQVLQSTGWGRVPAGVNCACWVGVWLEKLGTGCGVGWMNQAYSRLSTTYGHITDCKLVCMYWTLFVLVRPAASLYSASPLKHHPTGKQWCHNPDHYSDSEPATRSLTLLCWALSRAAEPQILTSLVWRDRASNHQRMSHARWTLNHNTNWSLWLWSGLPVLCGRVDVGKSWFRLYAHFANISGQQLSCPGIIMCYSKKITQVKVQVYVICWMLHGVWLKRVP